MLNDTNLKKLRNVLKQRVLLYKPIFVTWYPNNMNVCPSSIAKFFHLLGGHVTQKLPEINVTRDKPTDNKIPKVQISNGHEKHQESAISVYDFENIFAATLLELPK